MTFSTRRRTKVGIAVLATVGLTLAASPAIAAYSVDSTDLTDAVTAAGLRTHLDALQAIAEANGDTRAAGTPGYRASLDYVQGVLEDAGYSTRRQTFEYERPNYTGSIWQQTAPTAADFEFGTDWFPMTGTANDTVDAAVVAVDINLAGDRASSSGCEPADFESFIPDTIALIQRGTCNFSVKAANAEAAGAAGVIIFNQGNVVEGDDRLGLFGGTLEGDSTIPVISTTFAIGEKLALTEGLEMHLAVSVVMDTIRTQNLLADTPTGRTDRKVVLGAHLDSVPEGPGINDNGTGTATLLEIAVQLDALRIEPRNQVRFAFWGGEEDGLNGSNFYVSQLTKAEIKQHAVNLNFDMLGSPNPVRFIYDGDGDAFGATGPNGSDVVEGVFTGYFDELGLPSKPTEFDGRSDYFAFINAGIPAGGLFSGAEGIKSAGEAALFGGTAGAAYDPCYHSACDTIDNIDWDEFEIMADAAAHATLTFAETTSAVNGTAKGKANGKIDWENKGNRALR